MQDMYNLKIFEVQKVYDGIISCKRELEVLTHVVKSSLHESCTCQNESPLQTGEAGSSGGLPLSNQAALLLSEAEKNALQEKLQKLEAEKEKLNEELVDSEDLSELIKIKYALLLSNYASCHKKPPSVPKREFKTFIQKLMNLNKTF